jgi:hypothetical protein
MRQQVAAAGQVGPLMCNEVIVADMLEVVVAMVVKDCAQNVEGC